MCLVGEIRTATESKGHVEVLQTDSLSTEQSMLIPGNAQNTYLIYSVCSLLLEVNCSNVLNTLFINKAVVNLATRPLVHYNTTIFITIEIDCAIYLSIYLFIKQSLRARDLTSFTIDLQTINYYSLIHCSS